VNESSKLSVQVNIYSQGLDITIKLFVCPSAIFYQRDITLYSTGVKYLG
jgi:hypothetical protein